MSSAPKKQDRASGNTSNIGCKTQLAPNDEPHSLYTHCPLQTRVEDYSVSRIVYDTAPEDQELYDNVSKVEALIMSEVADYLQASQCDDFWRPRNQPPQKVSVRATHRWPIFSNTFRLFLLQISFSHGSETSKKPPIQRPPAPKLLIFSYRPLPYNSSRLVTPSYHHLLRLTSHSSGKESVPSRSLPCECTPDTALSPLPAITLGSHRKPLRGLTYTKVPRSKNRLRKLSAHDDAHNVTANMCRAFQEMAGQMALHRRLSLTPEHLSLHLPNRALLRNRASCQS